jgi:hypothetical protein
VNQAGKGLLASLKEVSGPQNRDQTRTSGAAKIKVQKMSACSFFLLREKIPSAGRACMTGGGYDP